MFHVDWSAVATDALLDELRRAAGSGPEPKTAALRPVVATILRHCGGLPVTPENWSEARRTAVGRQLLHEALAASLRRVHGRRRPLPGCDLAAAKESGAEPALERRLVERPRVDVNRATAADLESLPVLGPALAERTIAERRVGGPFASASELADRISGVGESGARRLGLMLRFGSLGEAQDGEPGPFFANDFAEDLKLFLHLQADVEPRERLSAALEALAACVAAKPHPANRSGQARQDLLDPAREDADWGSLPVQQVEVLEDEGYHTRVRKLLSTARDRIDLAMFFVAAPSPSHPSRQLLERLVEAKEAGVAVRVLLDRDREEDPYGSRIINADAIAFLSERGVPLRVDREDRLLHSKFVAVDKRIAVVGSHNWTAGSFFRYHDISLALTGPELAQALHDRFEKLWTEAQEP